MWRRTCSNRLLFLCLVSACRLPAAAGAVTKAPGGGGALALTELLQRIDAAQQGVRALSADFVQHSRIKLFKQELTSRGRLLYQRAPVPRLRWDYLSPDPSTLVLTGKQARMKLPGRPVQEFDTEHDPTLRAIFDELWLWLGQGSLRAAQADYQMSAAGTRTAPRLLLVPRDSSPLHKTFSRVELRLDPATLLLQGLLLVEQGGDEKEIVFTRMERNVALPDEAFRL